MGTKLGRALNLWVGNTLRSECSHVLLHTSLPVFFPLVTFFFSPHFRSAPKLLCIRLWPRPEPSPPSAPTHDPIPDLCVCTVTFAQWHSACRRRVHLRLTHDQVARRWLHMGLSAAFQGLREHVEVGVLYVCVCGGGDKGSQGVN